MSTADDTSKPALIQIAEHFHRHGVEFLVIGGQAAALFGSPIPTYDVDLCYRRTSENLNRLADAMHIARYNYCWRPRENGNSGRKRLTPAMQAGVVDQLWTFEDLYDAVMG